MFGNQSQQQNGSFDPFGAIADSDPTQGGVYFAAGVYPVLQVDVFKLMQSRKGELLFIGEFDILESHVSERPAGTRASYVANFRHDATPGNVKALIAATMNADLSEVTKDAAQTACSPQNPCHGRLVRLEASMTKTKQGNDFTLHKFLPIPNEVQEKAAELREKAGFPPF